MRAHTKCFYAFCPFLVDLTAVPYSGQHAFLLFAFVRECKDAQISIPYSIASPKPARYRLSGLVSTFSSTVSHPLNTPPQTNGKRGRRGTVVGGGCCARCNRDERVVGGGWPSTTGMTACPKSWPRSSWSFRGGAGIDQPEPRVFKSTTHQTRFHRIAHASRRPSHSSLTLITTCSEKRLEATTWKHRGKAPHRTCRCALVVSSTCCFRSPRLRFFPPPPLRPGRACIIASSVL